MKGVSNTRNGVQTAGKDPAGDNDNAYATQSNKGYDSFDEAQTIFQNWDQYSAWNYKLIKQLFNEAIDEILDKCGGFPDVSLRNLPTYRTSKTHILKKMAKSNEMQLTPQLPDNLLVEQDGTDFNKTKISAGYLEAKKQRKIY